MADSPKSDERKNEMHGLQPQDLIGRTLQTAANSEAVLRLRRLPMTGGWGNITVISKPLSSDKLTRYVVTIDNGAIKCSCPAARYGKKCRHLKTDRICAYKSVVAIIPAIIARAEARENRRKELMKNKQKPVDLLAVMW